MQGDTAVTVESTGTQTIRSTVIKPRERDQRVVPRFGLRQLFCAHLGYHIPKHAKTTHLAGVSREDVMSALV